MDLNKSREFFDPNKVKGRCHIIGCGSIGSHVAELLARYGIKKLTLYDFDVVEPHNLVNQNFYSLAISAGLTIKFCTPAAATLPMTSTANRTMGPMAAILALFFFKPASSVIAVSTQAAEAM